MLGRQQSCCGTSQFFFSFKGEKSHDLGRSHAKQSHCEVHSCSRVLVNSALLSSADVSCPVDMGEVPRSGRFIHVSFKVAVLK